MNLKIKTLFAVASLLAAGVGATSASASTPFQLHHPRRVEVNARLETQNDRIHEARRDGKLTPFEAFRLHRADHHIRMQERRFASRDGGHITRGDQRVLNHEENRVGHHI